MAEYATDNTWIDRFWRRYRNYKAIPTRTEIGTNAQNRGSEKKPEPLWVGRTCLALLWVGIVGYIVLLTQYNFDAYRRFAFHSYDLAIFDQAAWLISHGRTPYVSVRDVYLLADHFSVILYFLAPIYRICPDARVLLAVQTICLALGAVPLYAIAIFRTRASWIALLFAFAYLCYPALHYTNLGEFHPETLAVPCLVGACYYLLKRQWSGYFALLVVATCTKETVSITVLCIGIYSLMIDRRLAWSAIVLGLLMYMVSLATITHFNAGVASPYYSLYADYGGSIPAIMWNVIRHPWDFASKIDNSLNRKYLFDLLHPLLFLPLLAPEIVFLALPALLGNLLSYRTEMHAIYRHYTPLITPFLLWAAIVGFDRVVSRGNRLTVAIVAIYLLLSVIEALSQSPIINSRQSTNYLALSVSRQVDHMLRLIPVDASVAADVELSCHLSHRRQAYMFPAPFYPVSVGPGIGTLRQQFGQALPLFSPAEFAIRVKNSHVAYVALCPRDGAFPVRPDLYARLAIKLLQSPAYGIISIDEHTIILRYGADHQTGLRLFAQKSGVSIVNVNAIGQAYYKWHPTKYAAY